MADIPRNLPEKWIVTTFGQMAGFINGYAFAPDDWRENGLPIIRIEQLRNENAKADYYDRPLQERYRIRNGDLIFSWSASLLTRLWDRGDAYLNQHLFKVQNCSGVDRVFLKYLIDFNIDAMASETHGSTMKHITRPALLNYKVQIPINPDEQRQIADILSILDEAIAWGEVLVRKYQSIKRGLISDLLRHGTRKNRSLVKAPIGLMPKEWDLETIGSIAVHVGSGSTPKGGSKVYLTQGVLFIRSQNVTFDGLHLDDVAFIDAKTHEQMERSEIFAHDLLLNITGASIGRCCPFPKGFGEANVNQHVCAIRLPKPNHADAIYLSTVLESWVGQSQIETLNAGGNRQGLNYQQLRSFNIPWPEENERAEIAEIIENCNSTLSIERENFEKLSALKQGLMQDLLSGQVRVVE
jgi:type I restriction enzyme S subunit